jgi:hypothetical protein
MRPSVQASGVLSILVSFGSIGASSNSIESAAAAIAVAKPHVADECTKLTPCKFKAKSDKGNWNVFVQFTKRNSPSEQAFPYPGGHVILVIDKRGKLINRMEGE